MAKLYFRFGTMGSSKSANALMTRFNYIERGMRVLLMKPAIDIREGTDVVRSRIGLEAPALLFCEKDVITDFWKDSQAPQCIVVDEAQFATPKQIEEFREIVDYYNIPVFCYGLRTDFLTNMFPGSKRLFELADSITELKSVCDCGNKALVNARFINGEIVYEGEQIAIGGNDMYKGLCYKCWNEGRPKK